MQIRSFHRIQNTLIQVRHFSKKPNVQTRETIENMSFLEYASYLYNRRFGRTITPLGRWSIVEGEKVFNRSERANEDHCGACGDLYKNTDSK
uniref:Uncharacterized protein n=1 Tax=viral metagenome TaxID=1070528 RepID=A0A6C0EII5_9ZZZZ